MELPLPIQYKGVLLDCGYSMDIVVSENLLLELKSVEYLMAIHQAQILSDQPLANIPIGRLLNFNIQKLANGIKGFVL